MSGANAIGGSSGGLGFSRFHQNEASAPAAPPSGGLQPLQMLQAYRSGVPLSAFQMPSYQPQAQYLPPAIATFDYAGQARAQREAALAAQAASQYMGGGASAQDTGGVSAGDPAGDSLGTAPDGAIGGGDGGGGGGGK